MSFTFQSTRSQDRDFILWGKSLCRCISIHSVARPRHEELCSLAYLGLFQSTRSQDRDQVSPRGCTLPQYFNPLGRKTETTRKGGEKMPDTFQSTRSQDRDNVNEAIISCCCYFNPLGRKTETPLRNWPS